jgi:hypothetical protein
MTDIVTGMPAAIGYVNGQHGHGCGNFGNYGFNFNQGISDKDQMFAMSIDAGEHTRDLLEGIASTITATEKTGAASVLATEKIGAAAILESSKNTSALHVQIANAASASAATAASNQQAAMMYANSNASAGILFAAQNQASLAAQLAECCCDLSKEIADIKATILSVDASRIRDDLNEARSELLAIRYARGGHGGGGQGHGNN